MEKFVIIDGNSLVNRAFYALPMLANFKGEISNGVFGFTNILIKIINEINPKYICVAFDHSRKTFRNEIYSEYKGTRKPTPTELKSQFPILKDLLRKMNIKIIEQAGFEADDIIGSLTKKFKDVQNIIVTGDRDAFQLINNNTTVYFTKKGISETDNFTPEKLKEVYDITPSQVIELKALMGDASDNIPGVKGVGEKTATKLLLEYQTLENVYSNIGNVKGKLQERLINDKENAFLSKELATIKTDMNLDVDLKDFSYDYPFNENVLEVFKRYQFNSLLKRPEIFENDVDILGKVSKDIKIIEVKAVDDNFNNLLKQANKYNKIALSFDETLNIYVNDFEFVFNFDHDLLSQGLTIDEVIDNLLPILNNKTIEKTVFDYKNIMHILHKHNATISGVVFDTMIARHLINNNAKSNINVRDMLLEFSLSAETPAYGVWEITEIFEKQLKELELENLFYEMEMPLCEVLFDMEIQGFKIDRQELVDLNDRYSVQIDELTKNIYEVAGEVFNVNSPKQLSEILFNKLNLVSYNNKKNSTGIDILNQMINQHEIIPMIIEYRKITKLYNTYIKAFLELLDNNTNKIHTLFNQTITSTGRLSSVEPNLQNIPVRSEEGREFRKVFVSDFEDGVIVSADYSQIELRLLAGFSQDPKLIEAFNNNQDIHSITASEVMGVDLNEVTPDMRRDAKAINFGIIYGMSDYGLSQAINTSVATAKNYINKYFEKYPKVKEYMDKNIANCKETGYVKTLFGRIRNILEINSSNYNLRQFGERAAMNMPLQGSASDIIKVAMVKIFNEFNLKGLKSKLILQVHDELLVDCEPSELEIVKKTLKDCMENVVELPVKLTVNINHGKNWSET